MPLSPEGRRILELTGEIRALRKAREPLERGLLEAVRRDGAGALLEAVPIEQARRIQESYTAEVTLTTERERAREVLDARIYGELRPARPE